MSEECVCRCGLGFSIAMVGERISTELTRLPLESTRPYSLETEHSLGTLYNMHMLHSILKHKEYTVIFLKKDSF